MGHAVDGPRGPAGHIKPGLVHIAQSAGATIYPVLFEAEKYWTAASWDQHLIPKPFSRVRIRFGEAFHCPRRFKNKAELEQYVQRLQTIMRPCLVGKNLTATKHNRQVPPISSKNVSIDQPPLCKQHDQDVRLTGKNPETSPVKVRKVPYRS